MAFADKNPKGVTYYLHTMVVRLKGSGKKQTIYYFARKVGRNALDRVPSGYKVIHSRRTGLPLLKKG
ncbi:hypothetical protein A2973_01380 [Candidatus Gottesmanbacteria bacterium RIFCSPLOWO2_01_FULL_49_10]|uniref:Uncharacterized protein n=1 Tax=Candidatus Gottesmanbacteria bacterium RIFCSPLOWO2_01_FULL_49_10 TaxID=1798396 RepID=A0A1F6AX91_9BACT|nr:MAG: hypothetical protein A2973_01380 [Candidatus Gottesmanbacteria bacterium RIFCSPLOWO2_01_FULL_49_10]